MALTVACSGEGPGGSRRAESVLPAGRVWERVETSCDEFEGPSLDRSKWHVGIWYPSSGQLAFKDRNVSVADGCLRLAARKESHRGLSYTIGSVESKFEVPPEPSYVEVRAKMAPDAANVLSAIWLQSTPHVSRNPNPEIDIHEHVSSRSMDMHLHTWEMRAEGGRHRDFGGEQRRVDRALSAEFHLYGLERRDGRLMFYLDGRLVWDNEAPIPEFSTMSRHVVLSLEGHRGSPRDAHLPAVFEIDHVRVFVPSTAPGRRAPTEQDSSS